MKKIRIFVRTLFYRKIVVVCGFGVLFFVLVAIFSDFLSSYDPNTTSMYKTSQAPSTEHLLGTDYLGRDVFTRLIYGTRVSLIIGVLAVCVAAVIGVSLGLAAAYFGGWVDIIIMRICDAVMAIPPIMFALALIVIFGSGMLNLAIILGLTVVPYYIRMLRGQALSIKELDYIMFATTQGAKDFYIMIRHILPNSISPIIVLMTQMVGITILMESGLSFLGVGIQVPTPSWGTMVSEGKDYLLVNPAVAIVPGICIAVLVVCLNVVGDGVRDALDPKLRGEI
jgi:ABC-type dipeptide/oligopeptide/nickel transport system permease subunit